jgi:predicted DNA-binding protein YlxM (UPF0122 family)
MDELNAIGLTQGQVQVLALWAWDCLTVPEIAERLGITEGAAEIQLRRAKAKVKDAGLEVRRMVHDQPSEVIYLSSFDIDCIDPGRIAGVI